MTFLGRQRLGTPEQFGDPELEGCCQLVNGVQAWVSVASLDSYDVGPVEVCALGEILLRPSSVDPELPDAVPEGPSVGRLIEGLRARRHHAKVPRLVVIPL